MLTANVKQGEDVRCSRPRGRPSKVVRERVGFRQTDDILPHPVIQNFYFYLTEITVVLNRLKIAVALIILREIFESF